MSRTPFTAEQKRAVSERMKLFWRDKKAKAQGYQESPIAGAATSTRDQIARDKPTSESPPIKLPLEQLSKTGDKWRDLPFEEALTNLTKLEKEVTYARSIMVSRSALLPKTWTCWTALNRKTRADLPGMYSAYNQCAKDIPDGKWVFRDDCPVNPETGLLEPVVCCSNICYSLYQLFRNRARTKIRGSP